MVKKETRFFVFLKQLIIRKKTGSKLNVIYISSIFLAFLVYSKLLPLQGDYLISAVPQNEIQIITAKIFSNPVKSSDKYYTIKLKVLETKSYSGINSSANGIFTALIKSQTVESHYPKKLFSLQSSRTSKKLKSSKNKHQSIYSTSTNSIIIESGATIRLSGTFIQSENEPPFFLTEDIFFSDYKNTFTDRIKKYRALCRLQFKRLMSAWGRAGGLMLALLSSSKEYLEKSMQNAFKLSGLSHILALSGMHLSLVSTLFGFIENKSTLKTLGLFFKILMVFTFVFFAGFSPSLLRALISLLILSACKLLKIRPRNSIFVLSLTFLIHASIAPSDLTNLGFLLSYGALAGILFLSSTVNSIITKIFSPKISGSLSASVSAVTFTAPVSISTFGFFSPSGIICTMFVSPLITIFLYSGICLMLLSFLMPCFVSFSSFFVNGIYNLIALIVKIFSIIPVIKTA